MNTLLGIDIGGTGIKAALVDIKTGELVSERVKYATPKGGHPDDVLVVVKQLLADFNWSNKPLGVGFPAVIKDGVSHTASNVHNAFIGYPIAQKIEGLTGCPTIVMNDADAAGLAENLFGQGKDQKGTTLLLTLGTGIGSAIFNDGVLVPNTELGHLQYKGQIAEKVVSNYARKSSEMEWSDYSKELGSFLSYVHFLFNPNVIILGGGISKKFDKLSAFIPNHIKVLPAKKYNNAGIIGAAIVASQQLTK